MQLCEDPDDAAGQRCRPWRRRISAKQRLELLARRSAGVPQGPVRRGERSTKVVLPLMDLLCEA